MANTAAWNDELYANFVSAAEFAAFEVSVARNLMKLFPVPMNAGKVVQVPIWGQGSAQEITDEGQATAADTTSTSANITLNELVYYSQVTDMLRDSAYGDVMAQLAEVSGRAIGEKLDSVAFSKFSSLTAYSDLGSTTTELTTELVLKAAATLRSNKIAGPYYAVVHPNAAFNMKKVLTQTLNYSGATASNPALSNVGNQVLTSGIIGSIGGVTIIESPLLTSVTTGGATAYLNAVFAPTALGIAERGGLQLSTLYLPQKRATDLSVSMQMGAGVLQAGHGIKITAEGTV
jgi:N4-gp56 family major capsid protein